jgi:hypothetical protein
LSTLLSTVLLYCLISVSTVPGWCIVFEF